MMGREGQYMVRSIGLINMFSFATDCVIVYIVSSIVSQQNLPVPLYSASYLFSHTEVVTTGCLFDLIPSLVCRPPATRFSCKQCKAHTYSMTTSLYSHTLRMTTSKADVARDADEGRKPYWTS